LARAGAAVMAPILGVQRFLARTALVWSVSDLGRAAEVSYHTVERFERGDSMRPSTVKTIQLALEKAGVIFIDATTADRARGSARGRLTAIVMRQRIQRKGPAEGGSHKHEHRPVTCPLLQSSSGVICSTIARRNFGLRMKAFTRRSLLGPVPLTRTCNSDRTGPCGR